MDYNKTRFLHKIFKRLRLYNDSLDKWSYVKPPSLGDLKHSIAPLDHDGWMICDGRSLSKEEYAQLFALIGTTFGSVDGDHFNIPDSRGRVLGSIGSGAGLSARTLGQTVGEELHTLTINQMPAHTHTYIQQDGVQSIAAASGGGTTAADEPTKTSTTSSTGAGQAFNVMQPTIFIGNVFIYAF